MRIWLGVGMLIASTVGAYAGSADVPEIDAFSGPAAMGVVGSIGALIWERRRKITPSDLIAVSGNSSLLVWGGEESRWVRLFPTVVFAFFNVNWRVYSAA